MTGIGDPSNNCEASGIKDTRSGNSFQSYLFCFWGSTSSVTGSVESISLRLGISLTLGNTVVDQTSTTTDCLNFNNILALGLLSRDGDLLGDRPGHGVTLLHRTDGAHILHCVYFPQWHLSFVLCSFKTPWIITNIINTVKTRYCLTTLSLPSVCSSSKGNTGNSVSLNLGGVDNTDKGMFPWYSTLQTLWKNWWRLSCSFKLGFAPLLNQMTVKRPGLNARIFAFEPF